MRTLKEEMRLAKEARHLAKQPKPEASIEKSMRYNIWEGGFYGVVIAFTQNFLAPLALLFNASNLLISLLTTLPNLVGSILQLKATTVLHLIKSRKRYMLLFLSGQALVWLAIALLALVPSQGLALAFLLLLSVLAASLSLLVNPIWMSYIGDLVPAPKRNRYFGARSALSGGVTFVATLAAGVLLRALELRPVWGFFILFVGAAIARGASVICFYRSRDLTLPPKEDHFSIQAFLKRMPKSDFGRFLSLAVLLRFATYISAPFFVVYQLHVLNLNYLLFTILQLASLVTSFLSVRYWAEFAETKGNSRALIISSFLIVLFPFLWMTTNTFPALLLFQLISGVAWAGFTLASNNYMLEATSPKSRVRAISYFNLFNNIAIFLGGIVGSGLLWLIAQFTTSSAAPFLFVFGISGVLRLIVAIAKRPHLKELRFVEVSVKRGLVKSFISILPQQGLVYQLYAPTGGYVLERLNRGFRRGSEFDEFDAISVPKHILKRMNTQERELYKERYIEQAAGKQLPKKARGLRKK